MPIKTIIDGSLLAECEMKGPIRFGMQRVAEEINKFLLKNDSLDISYANTIYSYTYYNNLNKYIADNCPSYSNKVLSTIPFLNPLPPEANRITKPFIQLLGLEVNIRKVKENDLFFSYYYPFPKKIKGSKIKKCITLLDIISLRLDGYNEEVKNLTKEIIECIVPDFAISISEFSKQDLCDYDKRVDPERVFVVPLAASKELFFVNSDKDEWNRIKTKYQLPDHYFLSVSSIDDRKNLPHLIKSFNKFILQQNPKDLFLVLTGNTTYGHSILEKLGIEKKVREKIVLAKPIANEDLSIVYSNAECFFFMSLYEGFGLPALEAMQCGTPVVTSNATSLPEVVGDAGIMIDPKDEDTLCEAMNTLHNSEELRNSYSIKGLERSQQFSWESCANEYVEIFKKIATS
jgi:glycosyltransferase involved in cell wall biosynthesis